VGNDPVNLLDYLGLWGTGNHNWIIRKAFPSTRLPKEFRQFIEEGRKYADAPRHQWPKYSYMHAMRNSDQTPEEVMAQMNKYINDHLNAFKGYSKLGKCKEAYFELGMALHAVMDFTSPSHAGFETLGWDTMLYHSAEERTVSGQTLKQTVDLINQTLHDHEIEF
jgi:hypothetical protein